MVRSPRLTEDFVLNRIGGESGHIGLRHAHERGDALTTAHAD